MCAAILANRPAERSSPAGYLSCTDNLPFLNDKGNILSWLLHELPAEESKSKKLAREIT